MSKRVDHSTQLKGSSQSGKPAPSPQTGANEHDARDEKSKLAENQKDLGVTSDHKTEEMEKGGRGTFP